MIMLLPLAAGLVNGYLAPPSKGMRATISMDGAVSSRRAVLQTGVATASALLFARPESAVAAAVKMPKVDLQEELVVILRVQESCAQQTRLVKTGKFKELQRLNVKRAIRMMIDNSYMQSRFARATVYVDRSDVATATEAGATAVEALTQILEYFPQDLVANDLSPEQKKFVITALATTSSNIDRFVSLLPPEKVASAKAQIEQENELNKKEYEEFNDEKIVNMPTK
jgi:hypothetical protein